MKQTPELNRRRAILLRHLEEPVAIKRQHCPKRKPIVGVLVDVKRTRALLEFSELPKDAFGDQWFDNIPEPKPVFGESGLWWVPVEHILLPGSTEPLPGQRELFSVEDQR